MMLEQTKEHGQGRLVGGWDVSRVAQAGARKEAFEKARVAAGGGRAEVEDGENGKVSGAGTWVDFALQDAEEGCLINRPEVANYVRLNKRVGHN